MKHIHCLLLIASVLLVSCSKKTHPAASKSTRTSTRPADPRNTEPPSTTVETLPPPPAVAIPSPMIVIDDVGRVVTSREKLPAEIASKVDYPRITRSFTPVQRQNLIFRFKIIPPRVLYVPDQLVSKSAKGSYVIYRKKFYYWRKADGLFHLDETYYQ